MQSESIICKGCNKTFSKFSGFRKHIDLGRCKGSISDIPKASPVHAKPNRVTCPKCNKEFQSQYNLNRHSKSACKTNRVKDLLSEPEGQSMMERLLEIMLKNSPGNTTNNNHGTINNNTENNLSTNNTLNQTNNNNLTLNQSIHINPLGQESLDHISEDRIISILKKGLGAVPALFEAIIEKPENLNTYISDKRNKKVTYKDRDGKITIGDLKRIVNAMATDNIDRIDVFLDKYHDKLSKKDKTILRLLDAQGFVLPGEEPDEDSQQDEAEFDKYHERCEERIIDILELNKGRMSKRLKQYIANLALTES
jgi:flagellar hook protein FlgE